MKPQLWQYSEALTDWKRLNMTSIFKRGKKKDSGNYSPVSLSFVPSKITEQIVLEDMLRHIKHKWAFYDGMTALVDNGRAADVIYLDLCKAFDTVLHHIPLC